MSNKTILFADDSATMRAIMEKTFLAEPFDVVAVPSGEAAITKAKELHPDVIIVDVGLAGVTGYDVCEATRQDASLSGTPFVMISGVSNIYDARRGDAVGVDEHMKKPFDTTQMVDKVTELAGRVARPIELVETKSERSLAEADEVEVEPIPFTEAEDDEVEVEPIPLTDDEDEEVYTPDALTSLDSPLEEKPKKETLDFARPMVAKASGIGSPVPMRGIGEEVSLGEPEPAEQIPDVEPIEIKPEEPVSNSFQVGTLAELAQMDNRGTPIEVDTEDRSIELTTPKAVSSVAPKIREAAEAVAKSIPGATKDQVAAVQEMTAEVIERIVWEVVPDLAETIIKEELAKLLKE